MKLVAELPAKEFILTNFLVRLLMTKDIIPRSTQFFSQIGPSLKRFNELKMSDGVETDNMSLSVTDNFFEHCRDKNPRPHQAALDKIKKNCTGKSHTGSMITGVDIDTYAQAMGFKHTSGKQINKENQELERASEIGSGPALTTPGKRGAKVNQATFVLGCLRGERDLAAAAGEVTKDQQLMLQTVQEMTNAFLLQQEKVVGQQEMVNDVTRMDEEALRRFGDGPELVRVRRALKRGGRTEWDVDAAELTKKIFEHIADNYEDLRHLPQFHIMVESAGMALPPPTDIARSNEISGK